MKKELSPVAMVGILVVAVIALGIFGYKMLQPAPYEPSPGAGGKPGVGASSPAPSAPDAQGRVYQMPGASPGPPAR